MAQYEIGFKNSKAIRIELIDPEQLIKDVIKGLQSQPSAPCSWYAEKTALIQISEVVYVLPAAAFVKEEPACSP